MKIKYIAKDDVAQCRSDNNLSIILKEVILNKRKTLAELFSKDDIIKEISQDMQPIVLDMSEKENPSKTDAHNVKLVYEAMQGLTISQASEECLWTAYTLNEQLDYMIYRWNPKTENDIKHHFFFGYSARRSLFRNGMSRLWWLGYITKMDNMNNPYALTEFVCAHTDIVQFVCEQPVCQNHKVMHAVLSAMYDLDNKYKNEEVEKISMENRKGICIKKDVIQDLGKYLNLRAGTYLLDGFDYQQVYDMVRNHIIKFVNKKAIISTN